MEADYHGSDSEDAEAEPYAVTPYDLAYSDSRAAYGHNRLYVVRWPDLQKECLYVLENNHIHNRAHTPT